MRSRKHRKNKTKWIGFRRPRPNNLLCVPPPRLLGRRVVFLFLHSLDSVTFSILSEGLGIRHGMGQCSALLAPLARVIAPRLQDHSSALGLGGLGNLSRPPSVPVGVFPRGWPSDADCACLPRGPHSLLPRVDRHQQGRLTGGSGVGGSWMWSVDSFLSRLGYWRKRYHPPLSRDGWARSFILLSLYFVVWERSRRRTAGWG